MRRTRCLTTRSKFWIIYTSIRTKQRQLEAPLSGALPGEEMQPGKSETNIRCIASRESIFSSLLRLLIPTHDWPEIHAWFPFEVCPTSRTAVQRGSRLMGGTFSPCLKDQTGIKYSSGALLCTSYSVQWRKRSTKNRPPNNTQWKIMDWPVRSRYMTRPREGRVCKYDLNLLSFSKAEDSQQLPGQRGWESWRA